MKYESPESESATRRRGWMRNLKWVFMLWCVGVGAAVLLALPFHLLVALAMRR